MKRILLLCLFLIFAKSSLLNAQNFGTFASAVWITDCTTSNFFNTTGEGASIIGPVENTFTETNFGVFTQNSGTFILRGGEVKTFKNSSGNACSVRMNYRIYLESDTPGAFSIIDFPFFEDCNVGSSEFPSGGPCGEGDQKWQRVIADGETTPFAPIDLTNFTPGNYVLEVYYDATGDLNSNSGCNDTVFVNISGDNFKAYFTINEPPAFIFENPITCGGSEGSITISNLNANSVYLFSYSDDGDTIGPNSITTDENGNYLISDLNAGTYSDFNFIINNCTTTSTISINLTDPVVNPPTSGGNQTVCEASPIQTLTANATTSDGSTIVWYDSETGGNIIANPTLNTVGSVTFYAEAQNETSNCISLTRTAVTLTINPAPTAPTGSTTQTFCSDAAVVFTLNDLVVNGSNLQWYADADGTIPLPSNTPLVNNTTYYVSQTVDGCESNEYLAVLVFLNQFVTPTFNFESKLTICQNDTVPVLELISTNGIEGMWTPTSIDNTQNGVYTFESSDECATSFTLTVTITPPATPTFNFENEITICTVAQAPILPPTDNNGISGEWNPAVINEENGNTYTFTPNEDECANTFTLTVIISSFPSPVFDFGNTITICSGDEVPILPSEDSNGINGFWQPSAIDNINGGNYTFIANNSECAGNFDLTVIVNQPTIPTFSLPESVCFNSESFSLPSISDNGIEGNWNPSTINSTQETLYTFTPLNPSCTSTFSTTIALLPEFSIEITDQCQNNQFSIGVQLSDNSNIILTDYVWTNQNGVTVGSNSSTFNVTEYIRSTPETETFPLEFNVKATSVDGCFAEETISIPNIYCGIQKGISPNGDNLNDYFDLALLDVEKLSIFNRYGRKVYSLNNYTNQWYGQTDDGNELPSATYYFVIEFRSGESKTGWIYVMREESR